jgi:hypothetical protein
MESYAVRASVKGFSSESPGGAAGRNPVNCCGAAKGRARKAEIAKAPTRASNSMLVTLMDEWGRSLVVEYLSVRDPTKGT